LEYVLVSDVFEQHQLQRGEVRRRVRHPSTLGCHCRISISTSHGKAYDLIDCTLDFRARHALVGVLHDVVAVFCQQLGRLHKPAKSHNNKLVDSARARTTISTYHGGIALCGGIGVDDFIACSE
jgi:hypothetical protein